MSNRHPEAWYIPVHSAGGVACTLQTGHLPTGRPVGIAFTTAARLRSATCVEQEWLRMTEPDLREALAALGITTIQLDPLRVHIGLRTAAAS
ncbi:hypothetical protein HPO96_03520 [Kribbella sandramycini]|uniref:Uncharacterized protein n=1 Tax=Kribbella sandramycini TaxID=60450 RepID=A0A7Y4KVA3_9ACTN|nr:SAV_915 family protein [Kribbella sandramycini]MBB6568099.1 hypothetical protein [Kribbella sandramycini]NOL39307.1 hypothetical protein [Kribbella sandramycini]